MAVTRWAISVEKSLAKEIKRSAAHEPISAWLADAARQKLRSQGLLAVVADWEEEHGALTPQELATADRKLDDILKRHRTTTRARTKARRKR